MAKVKLPLQSVAVSGKVNSEVFYNSKGNSYVRSYSIPLQPNNAAQLAQRANFADLASDWKNTLTAAQRTLWSDYSLIVKNVFGDIVKLDGIQKYIALNGILLKAAKTRILVAPVAGMPPNFTVVEVNTALLQTDVISKPSAGDVSTFAPFLQVLVAGSFYELATVTNTTTIKMSGISQGINPRRQTFKHCGFIDENSTTDQTISFVDAAGDPLATGVKVSAIIIRYSKEGLTAQEYNRNTIVPAAV